MEKKGKKNHNNFLKNQKKGKVIIMPESLDTNNTKS